MRLRGAVIAGLACMTLPGWAAAANDACRDQTAILLTGEREVSISVEIADEDDERLSGLMHRLSVPDGTGMLFVFDEPQPVEFWMRNTLVPLDILFVDATGVVRRVHPDARPMDLTPIPGAGPEESDQDRLLVLEIGGGEAERLGIEAGTVLRHPRVPLTSARSPCPKSPDQDAQNDTSGG